VNTEYPPLSRQPSNEFPACPKCGSYNVGGPFDSKRSARFLLTRSWFCKVCWWSKEIQLVDDVAEAKDKAEKAAAKKAAHDVRRGRRVTA